MKSKQKADLTPHQRIVRAMAAGRGVRLSRDEVWWLAHDEAIRACAENDDEAAGMDSVPR